MPTRRNRSLHSLNGRSAASRKASRTRLGTEALEPRLVLDSTVVFNELMYNPADDVEETAEWIELYNQLAVDMDISEWELRGGVDYTFPDGTIVPGRGFLLVAANPSDIQAPVGVDVVGPFSGQLSNSGEVIRLYNNDDRLMNTIDYNDGGKWPTAPDGSGATLAKRNEMIAAEEFENWTTSAEIGGTPGAPNFPAATAAVPLVINEVSPLLGNKFIELANIGSGPVGVGGMVLHATGLAGGDYVIPAQSIAAGAKLVLTEAQLGVTMIDGERFFLYTADQAAVIDAQPITGRLRGRTVDGRWLYPDVATPNAANSFDFVDQIVINEIMYHHQPQLRTANTPYVDLTEEWIELYNRGDTAVDLTGWEIRDSVRYSFPVGTVIQPSAYLIVASDPVALGQEFPGIGIVGPFTGTLSNSADRISLVDANANPADEVKYFDSGQWDTYADGGGSSLELKDPFADNAIGAAWAASDESTKSTWQTYSASKVSTEPLGINIRFHEWVAGMLDSGEVLLDNISLKRGGTELLAGGTFDSTAVGSVPSGWRFIGNHDGTVVVDPDDSTNQVLHLTAHGAQQHVHDHVEVDFVSGQNLVDGQTYTISFDAKWVAGSRQLNNRLYFTRASNTIILDAPQNNGTPGAQNSRFVGNIGPTYTEFAHTPLIPNANQPVTVTVDADDPQGVTSMELYYSLNGGAWTTVPMSLSGGAYSAAVPGQPAGQVVQFYVEGTDSQGAVSTFPSAGADSRALYEVNDGQGTNLSIETFRIVLLNSDNTQLFSNVNTMSNNYVGGTLIVGDHTAFYDVGVRQIGSRFIRPNSGYKVQLSADNKYLGVHESVRFDIELLDEIIYKQMINRAGGSEVSMYDDLSYMISPQHTGRNILLNLARYESDYLSEQFQNGTDGTKFELDDITIPTSPNAQGFKIGTDAIAQDMRDHGPDPEAYRGQLLIKNNRAKDEFAPIAEFIRVINLSGSALNAAIDDVMDVDLWMRHYATQSFVGNWDTYGFRRPKNLRLYIRPSDGKIIPLYWDADRGNLTEPLIYNGSDSRLDDIRNIPRNQRLFWGHMLDLVNRSFNGDYAAYWTSHFQTLGGGTAPRQSLIVSRANQARTQAIAAIPMVNFGITTNGGNPLTVAETFVTLEGDGWIDVREVRLVGSDIPLNVSWTDNNSWRINVPLALGQNDISLEAFDFQGNRIGGDDITVTTTATQPPLRDQLRVSEIHYNPVGPDDTEFIELMHIGSDGSGPISLAGVHFSDGIDFTFTVATTLSPGDRVVVVSNLTAFEAFYGRGINVAGEFAGGLNNGGERITLIDSVDTVVQSFSFNDNWYPETDGGGYSLTIADPLQDLALWDSAAGWRLSEDLGGSPSISDDGLLPNAVIINEISNNDTAATGNWIELYNRTDDPIDISNWYLSDDDLVPKKYQFPAGTTIVEGGYIVLDETISFGNAGAMGANSNFGLSDIGGVLWLNAAEANGDIARYQFRRSYGAAEPDATQGIVRTSDGLKFATLTGDTRQGPNQGPVIGPIVINEIMYNPAGDGTEFIELRNVSNAPITLNNGAGRSWQITNGINYTFPAGEVLPANGFALLIQGQDGGNAQQTAADFRSANNVPIGVPIYVFETTAHGSLDNRGEELLLTRPSELVNGQIHVDEIDYDNSSPWPTEPDGTGSSLSKLASNLFGNEPSNWGTGSIGGTPGRTNVLVDTTPPSKPTNLVVRAISDTEVAMAWTPSVDDESGIRHYVIYRDNEVYATSTIPFFVDPDVTFAAEPVGYQVLAINGDNLESNGRSNSDSVGTAVVSFKEGVGGYSGGQDAELLSSEPNVNRSGEPTTLVGEKTGAVSSSLLRWDNLSIPDGRTILDAWFTVNVTEQFFMFDRTDIGNPFHAYRVLRDWNEGEATWNEFQNGQGWQTAGAIGVEDRGPAVGEIEAVASAVIVVSARSNIIEMNDDGLEMVREWFADPASNKGVVIASNAVLTDTFAISTSEAAETANRPELSVRLAPFVAPTVSGDFTLDDAVTSDDLVILCGAIRSGATHSVYDLDNSGGATNLGDLDVLLSRLGTVAGDANLDGRIDPTDLNRVGINWLESGNAIGWGSGDFTCDGRVDPADLNQIGLNWQFGVPAKARAPRAPLSAVTPNIGTAASVPQSMVQAVDIALSELDRPTEREFAPKPEQRLAGRDSANLLSRRRVMTQRSSVVATDSNRTELESMQQLADEIYRRFDVI